MLNVKGVDYKCVLWGVIKNDAINMLSNSKLDDKGILWIWILVQIKHQLKWLKKVHLKELIYFGVNGKWYKKSWKVFDELGNIDQKYYCSNHYDFRVNKHGAKYEISLRFWWMD